MKPPILLALALALGGTGCARNPGSRPQREIEERPLAVAAMEPGDKQAEPAAVGQVAQPARDAGEKEGGKPAPAVERKIKYTADIRVICEDFPKAAAALKAAIREHKGLVAHSEMTTAPGTPRTGTWRVRVPVAHFEDFRDAVVELGEVERNTSDSEDVTEAYHDLERHIKNKLAEEESLRKLLQKAGSEKLEHMLILRDKLDAVRDYIDREQGKLRLLANLTDLTTVTVALREKGKYVAATPPQTVETPTFGMRVDRTFSTSWDAFVGFGEFIALTAIAALPWLGLMAIVGIPAALLVRRSRRSAAAVAIRSAPQPQGPA